MMLRFPFRCILACVSATVLHAWGHPAPTAVEVKIEPRTFGDVASILKIDSTVGSFKFDQPVSFLALVLEAYPKETEPVIVGRLALELAKPLQEGHFCVQMADQGFLPLGNGAPHQMQLFMQLECGGSLVSSSQSFLKEKFNFSKSIARLAAGTQTRKIESRRAPVFWLMGNSDDGTYINDEDLRKMIERNNRDAYVLVAYLETSRDASLLARETSAVPGAPGVPAATTVPPVPFAFVGPPFPVPEKKMTGTMGASKGGVAAGAETASKSSPSKPSGSSSAKKKKKRSS